MTSLEGKVAVVTGASRGLGRDVAEALAGRGASVAAVARTAERFRCDVSRPDEVASLAVEIERELGRPQILVNAAGIFGPVAPLTQADPAEWVRTIEVDLVGPYLTCRAFAPGMVEAGWGRIVNVTSAASLHAPGPLGSAYATAKVGLNQLTRHLASELAGGVDVGAKREIFGIMRRLAAERRIVLFRSTELPELIGLCDRILVFYRGRLVGETPGGALDSRRLLHAINTGEVDGGGAA